MKLTKCFPVEGQRVRVRSVRPEDLESFVKWDDDDEIVKWSGKKFDGLGDARDWYFKRDGSRVSMAIETLSGELIGEIELLNISWRLHTGELRIVIGEKNLWGLGLGQEAVTLFVQGIFQALPLRKIFLRVNQDNKRAIKCYSKCGFRRRGIVRLSPRYGIPPLILMDIEAENLSKRASRDPGRVERMTR